MARAPADQLECKGAQSITCRCGYGRSGDMAVLVRRSEAIKYLQVYSGFFPHGPRVRIHKRFRTSLLRLFPTFLLAVQNITSLVPEELSRALALVTLDVPLAVQLFYFSKDALQQVQYSRGRWTSGILGQSAPNSSAENGPLTAVGWNNTAIRLYYLINGKMLNQRL
jgi:hypothetical protein